MITNFVNNFTLNNCNFNYSLLLNNSEYKIIETIDFNFEIPKLYPIISLYYIIENNNKNSIDLLYYNNLHCGSKFNKTTLLRYLFPSLNNKNIIKKVFFPDNIQYIIGHGIIRDKEQNTLLCFCFDITKVDFTINKISNDGIYLMLDIQRLSLPEHKKLFSIIKGIIDLCIQENIDIISTSKIDKKLFTFFNKEFSSLTDRKIYLQEKVKLLLQENLEDVVI